MKLRDFCQIKPDDLQHLKESQALLQVLNVGLQLNIFSLLKNKMTDEKLALENKWDLTTLKLLLRVLKHTGYVEEEAGEYQATAKAQYYLTKESFWRLDYLLLDDFKEGDLDFQLYHTLKQEDIFDSSEPNWNPERLRQIGMHSLTTSFWEVIDACDLREANKLLDLGGGHGFYSIAFAEKYPELEAVIFDLAAVIPIAEKTISYFGLGERVTVKAGSFLTDDLGTGFDVVLCSNVLHSDKRQIVLSKVYQALEAGGKIIVKNRVSDCDDNLANALSKLQWHLRGGRELYTQSYWHDLIAEHGFRNIKTVDVSGLFATMVAEK
ncbi:MAG: methyltransferase [bacterium]